MNNALPPQIQMIQQYQLLNGSLMNVRQALERTDLSAEERNQLQAQERDFQQRLQVYQQLFSQLPPVFNPNQHIAMAQAAQQQQLQQLQQQQQQQQQQQPQAQQQQQQALSQSAAASPSTSATTTTTTAATTPVQTPVTSTAGGDLSSSTRPVGVTPMAAAGAGPANPLDLQSQTIVSRRQLQQLAPTERLEPEVEEILMEAADEFIESVTQFACHLAKHRKSDTLQVKDLQLHLERNWNVRIPGFASDDIKSLKKPVIPASHQSKVSAVNAAKSSSHSKKDHH
ncbi:transcription initiation factor tfiid subunit12 [Lichtheimia corymbifera JMRC:FSU:9682]|uniref:TBP-associated factor 12 n=1 Tax=Lichtheimia corymbifera JMRC:FSU:9682 TaxID=1263082 RepID=A0A068S3C1_9FUNG|nr:transcription initiation factor tfiid subunit12 [Lichtheimia corymbifera JMRC:FSU:9682]